MIDLRSDTVSKPTIEMRNIIKNAEVGDDVIGDDFTVKNLENEAAKITGKESALYVPSGTMGNLIALLVHCLIKKVAIVGSESHILWHEGLGATQFGGIHLLPVDNASDGTFLHEQLLSIINDSVGKPGVICLENTHNRCGGSVIDEDYINQVFDFAKSINAAVHMDGARIFNAATALDCNVIDLVKNVDSVSFCFSKGLGAPIGSVLCGSTNFIQQSRSVRRTLGGGMRQAGIIASAASYALKNNIKRLKDDHGNAKLLAGGLSKIKGIYINEKVVQTNIVYFSVKEINGDKFVDELNKQGLLVSQPKGTQEIRAVTHLNISSQDIKESLEIISSVTQKLLKVEF